MLVIHLYRILAVPHFEYAFASWSPYYCKYFDAIQNVQRRFKKFHLPYCDHESKCKALSLLTLRRRKMLHDEMLLFKIFRGRMCIDSRTPLACALMPQLVAQLDSAKEYGVSDRHTLQLYRG